MTAFRVAYRSLLLVVVVLTGCVLTVVFLREEPHVSENKTGRKLSRWWHKKMTQVMGIPVNAHGSPANEPVLFVCNHVSWFDINAIGSLLPARFLAKIEVKHMPVMGWLASRAGTLYIHRGHKEASNKTIEIMADALKKNHNVVLFAEGTTQDGNVSRFHSRLIQSAIDAGCAIQPVAIHYPSLNGEKVHPAALFVGDITMKQSIASIMSAKNLRVELHFLEPVSTTGKKRDELASHAEQQVRAAIENAISVN